MKMKRNVTKIRLGNGLRVLLEPDMSYPVTALQLWIKSGSIHEEEGRAGISHFVEHLLFRGTNNKSSAQINQLIEECGGEINAYTSFEQTAYHVVITARHSMEGLDVISDIVQNPKLSLESVEGERKVILEEIKEGEDNPDVLLAQKLFSNAYAVQPYRRPVIGYRRTVEGITRQDICDHFDRFYVPNNMVFSVAGSFEPEKMEARIRELFSKAKYRPMPEHQMPAEPPPSFKYAFLKKGESESIFELSFPIPSAYHSDMPALDVLSVILGEGDGSRLNQGIVSQKGLAKEAVAHTFTPFGTGMLLVRAAPFNGKFGKAFGEILCELWKIQEGDITKQEVERAYATIEKELIFQSETVYGRSKKLAFYESFFGDCYYEDEYLRALKKVKACDVKDVARRYLRPENMVVAALYPEDKGVLSEGEISAIIEDSARPFRIMWQAPVKRAISTKPPAIKEYSLSNGVRIVARKNKTSPVTSIVAIVPGGVRSETAADNGISSIVSNLIQKGTGKRNYAHISHEISMLGAYTESFVGKNSFGFKMDCVQKNFDKALDVFSDMLTASVFAEDQIANEKQKALEDLEALKNNFEAYGYLEFMKMMYKDHPYGLNSIGTRGSLEKIDRGMILERYRRILDPGNMIIGVAGSFDERKLLNWLQTTVGTLIREKKNDFQKICLFDINGPIESRKPVKSNNAYIHMGFRGTRIDDEDKFALEVVNAALSSMGEGRLYSHLREKMGLAYSVLSVAFNGIEDGYLLIYLNTDPKNVEIAVKEIKDLVNGLHDKGLSEEELKRAKNYIVGSYDIELQRNSNQSITLALNKLYGIPLPFEDYAQGIMRVGQDSVRDAIKKYLNLDKYVLSILTP